MKISKASAILLPTILASSLLWAITYQSSPNEAKQVFVGLKIRSGEISATVDFKPDVLNLRSKGRWISVYVELPEDFNVVDIDVSSMTVNDTISAELSPTEIGDYDNDTIPDLMVKLERLLVSQFILSKGIMYGNVTLTMTGELYDGTIFEGIDIIRARMPGDVNVDGRVDGKDIAMATRAFATYPEHPRWNCLTDENEDNRIDGKDIASIARNIGKTYT